MQDSALVRLCPGECELRGGAAVGEQRLTCTQRQGKDEQMQLVDEPVGEHRSYEGAAAADVEVAVEALLQLTDRICLIRAENRRVVPLGPLEGGRDDVLRDSFMN